ncbi:unnamed protein product [Ostreobium quekettii]|uniref:Nicotinate-nucleotide adenylyltransferase n=1 Tax=Ostreobium quekettii TaxID=121088 RepID=A0A8S1J0A0_9CHLO|nr:unnamed protein product [Ostreobium quekettii]|eukprot:evm.model.scf_315.4 EVM.evm.TU.scf_315.4   scf_315:51663-58595(-)
MPASFRISCGTIAPGRGLDRCAAHRVGVPARRWATTALLPARSALAGFNCQSAVRRLGSRGVRGGQVRAQLADASDNAFTRTAQKALEVNLHPEWYGTFAEIGAGQEVARWFFRVGGAAGTIAKSVSAYDMTVSDSMYGACERYVTKERLEAMLDYEYLQCSLTLKKDKGHETQFFAFADTVVAKAYKRDNECHGWLGIKFQMKPMEEPCRIVIHCRMLEDNATAQQVSLGVLGVNLIHSAFIEQDPFKIVNALSDELGPEKIEIDVVDFSGPRFEDVDDRLVALRLVQNGQTDAAIFAGSGKPMIPQEALRKMNVLLLRGRFKPFTLLHNDMLVGAANQFFCNSFDEELEELGMDSKDYCVQRDDTQVILEITTKDMMESGDLLDWTSENGMDESAFLQRMEALNKLGYIVMLSGYQRYFQLAAYLRRYTNKAICITMGPSALQELFRESHYRDLPGGILENFGRLLRYDLKLYMYPTVDTAAGKLITANNLKVESEVQLLYDYILKRGTIVPITMYDESLLSHGDVSKRVVESIRAGTSDWENLVPTSVAEQIRDQRLWGYRPPAELKAPVLFKSGEKGPTNGSQPAETKAVA